MTQSANVFSSPIHNLGCFHCIQLNNYSRAKPRQWEQREVSSITASSGRALNRVTLLVVVSVSSFNSVSSLMIFWVGEFACVHPCFPIPLHRSIQWTLFVWSFDPLWNEWLLRVRSFLSYIILIQSLNSSFKTISSSIHCSNVTGRRQQVDMMFNCKTKENF